jgi:S-formylglutathione hydrolase FrmB
VIQRLCALALFSACGLVAGDALALAPVTAHRTFQVTLPANAPAPVSGRLLIFIAHPGDVATDGKVTAVDTNPFSPKAVSVTAREIEHLVPGATVSVDGDELAFPAGFSALPAGDYVAQAVLDLDHSYAYNGRGAGDLVSAVVPVTLGGNGSLPVLSLDTTAPARDPWTLSPKLPAEVRDAVPATRAHTDSVAFVSPALSRFWGRPITMKGWVVRPPGYDAKAGKTYPTVYFTHGFTGTVNGLTGTAATVYAAMAAGKMPPMIWVLLDESSATGTHEFADSVNNGPWGLALTTELIPSLEKQYRMDARVNGRFLNGHSSGGWATLWLQTRYPQVFGGTWSTSPDPSDFHDFTGSDLYAANANVYRKSDGSATPLVRDKGKVIASFETFAQLEDVMGEYGGQLGSFEWVFSPRGADGRPQRMFDRATGAVDPTVVAYWRDNYDIAFRVKRDWPTIGKDLDGKIHLIVGTADTFYLDGAAHRLKDTLDALHARSDIRFLEGRTHFDLYVEGGDRNALLKKIAWEMYKVARPDVKQPGG